MCGRTNTKMTASCRVALVGITTFAPRLKIPVVFSHETRKETSKPIILYPDQKSQSQVGLVLIKM